MTTALDGRGLRRRLERDGVVVLPADVWAALAPAFPEVARHPTGIAGDLVIVRVEDALAAVEQPAHDERVVRYLGSQVEAEAFVEQRLAEYERMWEGCGCRIDYFAATKRR